MECNNAIKQSYTYVATKNQQGSADGNLLSCQTGDLIMMYKLDLFGASVIDGCNMATGQTGSFPSGCLKRCIRAKLLRDFRQHPAGSEVLITELSTQPPGCCFYCGSEKYNLAIEKFNFDQADNVALVVKPYSAGKIKLKVGQIVWILRKLQLSHSDKWVGFFGDEADYFPGDCAIPLKEVMGKIVSHAIDCEFDQVKQLASQELLKMHVDNGGYSVLLMLADCEGNSQHTTKCIDYLIYAGCDPFDTDAYGNTAAHLAAKRGHLRLLALLPFHSKWLQNNRGFTPLMLAVKADKWRCVKHLVHLFRQSRYKNFKKSYLIERMSSDGQSALDIAKQSGKMEMARIIEFEISMDVTTVERNPKKDGANVDEFAVKPPKFSGDEQSLRTICECDTPDAQGRTNLWNISDGGKIALDFDSVLDKAIKADSTSADTYGNTCLHAASLAGNFDAVRALIATDAYVNARAEDEGTPLMRLASSDRCSDSESVRIAQLLLNAYADWTLQDKNGNTALQLARASNKERLVKMLEQLETKSFFDTIQLPENLTFLKPEATKSKAQLTEPEMSEADVFTPQSERLERKVTMHVFQFTSHAAHRKEPFRLTTRDTLGRTPVAVASLKGDNQTLYDIMQSGSKKDVKEAVNWSDNSLQTPIMLAASNNHPNTIQLLHEMGADVHCKDRGERTALMHAAKEGHKNCVTVLLQLRANAHTMDYCGNTPLIWAARENHAEVIMQLRQHLTQFSHWSHRGEYNMTALQWARYLQHSDSEILIRTSIERLQNDARESGTGQHSAWNELLEAAVEVPAPPISQQYRYPLRCRASSRGVAILINNVDFDDPNLNRRHGAMEDIKETGLYQAFDRLGLRVEIHVNVSSHFLNNDLLSMNKPVSDYEQYDVFLLCIMSHGEDGCVFGSDGQRVELESLFSRVRQCPQLDGKPKIFVLQACRIPRSQPAPAQLDEPSRDEDCLYIYSTSRGHYSYRCHDTGCYFTQALKEVILDANLRVDEFTHLLPRVVSRVFDLSNGVQVVHYLATLRKLMLFSDKPDR